MALHLQKENVRDTNFEYHRLDFVCFNTNNNRIDLDKLGDNVIAQSQYRAITGQQMIPFLIFNQYMCTQERLRLDILLLKRIFNPQD
jgi:hypothetical protein